MPSPYQTILQILREGTEDAEFHELEGVNRIPMEGETIYLNDVAWKVESVTLHLYDNTYTNPTTGGSEWGMLKEMYKVHVSVPA